MSPLLTAAKSRNRSRGITTQSVVGIFYLVLTVTGFAIFLSLVGNSEDKMHVLYWLIPLIVGVVSLVTFISHQRTISPEQNVFPVITNDGKRNVIQAIFLVMFLKDAANSAVRVSVTSKSSYFRTHVACSLHL